MSAPEDFEGRKREAIRGLGADSEMRALTRRWFDRSCQHRYSYHFSWLGRPIIQYPQDIVATQEILWAVQPDVVIETGIAHGGSLILSASILELMRGDGIVIGIDIDIRPHNRAAIEAHPLFDRIRLVEGSSTDPEVVARVREICAGRTRAVVLLDSMHTHEHVLEELELYSPFVCAGSYLVVYDTVIEQMPADAFPDRPWGPGNNPMTAVREFLAHNDRFAIDEELEQKLQITVAPSGFLKCVKD
jgi:cephalosporin hydroxylase